MFPPLHGYGGQAGFVPAGNVKRVSNLLPASRTWLTASPFYSSILHYRNVVAALPYREPR